MAPNSVQWVVVFASNTLIVMSLAFMSGHWYRSVPILYQEEGGL